MHNNEQMIKPEQDSKVEKPHLLLPLNRKRTKTQNLHNRPTLQLNTMEENITNKNNNGSVSQGPGSLTGQIGNNVNLASASCRGRLCCRYFQLYCRYGRVDFVAGVYGAYRPKRYMVRGQSNTVNFVDVDRVEFNFVANVLPYRALHY